MPIGQFSLDDLGAGAEQPKKKTGAFTLDDLGVSAEPETGVALADPGRRAVGESFTYDNDSKLMTRDGKRLAPTYVASATVTAAAPTPEEEIVSRNELPPGYKISTPIHGGNEVRARLKAAKRSTGKPIAETMTPEAIQRVAGTDKTEASSGTALADTPKFAEKTLEVASYLGVPFEEARRIMSAFNPVSEPEAPKYVGKGFHEIASAATEPLRKFVQGSPDEPIEDTILKAPMRLGGLLTEATVIDPVNAVQMAAGVGATPKLIGGFEKMSPLTRGLEKALGLSFLPTMAESAIQSTGDAAAETTENGVQGLLRSAPQALVSTAFTALSAKHAGRSGSDAYYNQRGESLAKRTYEKYGEALASAKEKAKANLDASRSTYDGMTADEVAAFAHDRKAAATGVGRDVAMRMADPEGKNSVPQETIDAINEQVRDMSLRRGPSDDELAAVARSMFSDRPDVKVQIHEDTSTLPRSDRTVSVEGDVTAAYDRDTNTVHVVRPRVTGADKAVVKMAHEKEHSTTMGEFPAHKVADMGERQFKEELFKLTEEGALPPEEFARLMSFTGRDFVREVKKANTGPDSPMQIAADEVVAVMREGVPIMPDPSKLDVLVGRAARAIPGVEMTAHDVRSVAGDLTRSARGEFTPDRPVETVGNAPDMAQPGEVYAADARVGPQQPPPPPPPIAVGDRVSAVGPKGKPIEGVLEKVSKSGKTAMVKLDDGKSIRVDFDRVTRPEPKPAEPAPVAAEALVAQPAQQPVAEATIPAVDRRTHGEMQGQFEGRRWSDLTDAERIARGYQNELSGLPGKRYWDDAIDTPDGRAQRPDAFFYDLDDFKMLNDRLSHEGVDKMVLPFLGDAIKEVWSRPEFRDSVALAHRSGDEFTGRSPSSEVSDAFVSAVNDRIRNAEFVFEHNGQKYYHKGLGGSHGTGPDIVAAESASKRSKAERRARGERVGYRDSELGLPPAGREAGGDQAGREVVPADAGAGAEVAPSQEAETAPPASDGLRLSRSQTKTPEFKQWFGDWEKDPANASKVVDENGTPRIVYHGTLADEFSSFRSGSGTPDRMLGPHFSETPATADAFTIGAYARDHNAPWGWVDEATVTRGPKSEYNEKGDIVRPGGKTYAAYLDIRNPLDLTGGKEWFDQAQIARSVAMHAARTNPELFRPLFDRFARDGRVRVSNRDRTLSFNELLSDAPALERFVQSNGGALFGEAKPMVDWFKATSGYDGIKYTNSSPNEGEGSIAWIAFHPDRQVKSAIGNTGAFGSRPPTEAEAPGLGMTVPEAVAAQKAGDIRLSRSRPNDKLLRPILGDLVELSAQMMADKRNGIESPDALFDQLATGMGEGYAKSIKRAAPYLYEQAQKAAADRADAVAAVKTALEQKLEPKKTLGTSKDSQTAEIQKAVDYAREQAGIPDRKADAQTLADGQKLFDNLGVKGIENLVIERSQKAAGTLTDAETVAAKIAMMNADANKQAMNDPRVFAKRIAFMSAYRMTGTEQARSFRQRRWDITAPIDERVKNVLYEVFMDPSEGKVRPNDLKGAESQLKKLKDFLKKELGVEDIESIPIEKLTDEAYMTDAVRKWSAENATLSQKARTWYLNSLVSAFKTHAANLTGNMMNFAMEYAAHRRLEARLNQLFGIDGVMPSDLKGMGAQMLKVQKLAWEDAMQYLKTGKNRLEESVFRADWVEQLRKQKRSFSGKAGTIIEGPTRMLGTEDAYFVSLIGHMEAYSSARQIARSEMKLKPGTQEYNDAVDSMLRDYRGNAWRRGMNRAEYLTFKDETGKFVRSLLALRRQHPSLTYITPFLTTPVNLISRGAEFVPGVGLVFRDIAKNVSAYRRGEIEASEFVHKYSRLAAAQAIGLGATLTAAALGATAFKDDNDEPFITGSEPPASFGRAETEARRRSLQPYTIKLPFTNERISYRRLDPLSTAIGLNVDLINLVRDTYRTKDYSRMLDQGKNALLGQLVGKTFLKGPGDWISWIQNEPGAPFPATEVAIGMYPNALRQFPQAFDPYVRENRGYGAKGGEEGQSQIARFLQTKASRATGFPIGTEPKVNLYGEEVRKTGNPLYRMLVPFDRSGEEGISPEGRAIDLRFLRSLDTLPEDVGDLPIEMAPKMKLGPRTFQMFPEDYAAAEKERGQFLKQIAIENGILDDPRKPLEPWMVKMLRDLAQTGRERAVGKLAPKYMALPQK